MSQRNVELVRRCFDALSDRDIDLALAETADDFEMDWSNSIGPARGIYRGKEGVRVVWGSLLDAFENVRWEPEEFIEIDETTLIVLNRVRMRGRGSGVEVDGLGAQLWTIRDGEAKRVKLYQSKDEALEALDGRP
jgi:ketosteroid isomerase-like protein